MPADGPASSTLATDDRPTSTHRSRRAEADPGDEIRRWRRSLEGIIGVPFTEGNRVERLRNGVQIFPAMLDAVRGAERTIDFLTFIYWTGNVAQQFAHELADKARAGVRVRVLLDAVGARFMSRDLVDLMRRSGAVVEFFRPPTTWKLWELDHRTHRKLLVVDEQVAFTGGVGIAQEWEGDARTPDEWRDSHFRFTGPAVDGLRAAFLANWLEVGRAVLDDRDRFPFQAPAGDSLCQVVRASASVGWNDATLLIAALFRCARRRIRIASAYFTPDDLFIELARLAVERDVELDVLVPGPHIDKRLIDVAATDKCRKLAEAGGRIWRYQPTMLHTKVITVDDVVSVVGSVNVNSRSMKHDEEVAVVVLDPEVAALLDRDFDHDLEQAELTDADQWTNGVGMPRKVGAKLLKVIDSRL